MKRTNLILFFTIMSVVSLYAQKESHDVRKGNKLYNDEKYTEAEVEYRKGLDKNSRSFEANYNLGNALFRQEKYEDALTQYSNALANKVEDKQKLAAGYHNLGNALLLQNKVAESIDAYKMALKNNPKDDDTRYNLAYAQQLLKQQQEQQQNQQQDQEQKEDKQQEQEQQNQQQQQEQNQNDQQQEQEKQQPQQQEPQLSKENAQQLLDALLEDEKGVQEKVKKQNVRNQRKAEKDW